MCSMLVGMKTSQQFVYGGVYIFIKLYSTCHFYLPGMCHDNSNLCLGFEPLGALLLILLLHSDGCCRWFILL